MKSLPGAMLTLACLASPQSRAQAPYTVSFGSSAPFDTDIFISDADGRNAVPLVPHAGLDSNASFSADGRWIVFTSQRSGPTKIFRVHPDGSGLEQVTDGEAFDDQAAFSPDGTSIAFVSTRGGQADVWVLNLATKELRNVTNAASGEFRPSWSADGQWLAFSSDRDAPAAPCIGDDPRIAAPPFVRVQSTSIYVLHPDGSGLRRVSDLGRLAGTPRWSSTGSQVMFYDGAFADVCGAGTFRTGAEVTQIVSVDVGTGERRTVTTGPGDKAFPRTLADGRVAYGRLGVTPSIVVAGTENGTGSFAAPDWSPLLGKMVFHREVAAARNVKSDPGVQRWHSADPLFALQRTNSAAVACSFSRNGERLACEVSAFITGANGLTVANADGSNGKLIFEDAQKQVGGTAWSPDGEWIAFGFGAFFEGPNPTPTRVMLIRPDGSGLRALTSADENCSLPTWSPDGKRIAYRYAKGARRGLAILDVATGETHLLDTGSDHANFPSWSPRGDWISFTSLRDGNYDVYVIRPDGSGLRRLTTTPGNDAHSSFSPDGEWIAFATARGGFKDEAILTPLNFQAYGEIAVMRVDGSDVRVLTDNAAEEGAPAWVPTRH
jgi:Tol biopolymer transport system component